MPMIYIICQWYCHPAKSKSAKATQGSKTILGKGKRPPVITGRAGLDTLTLERELSSSRRHQSVILQTLKNSTAKPNVQRTQRHRHGHEGCKNDNKITDQFFRSDSGKVYQSRPDSNIRIMIGQKRRQLEEATERQCQIRTVLH